MFVKISPLISALSGGDFPADELKKNLQIAMPLLMAGLVAFYNSLRYTSPDMWWHLKAGQWILEHKSVPLTDPFSWTMNGQPWVAHEWLSEALFALAAQWGGAFGLVLLVALVAGVCTWLVIRAGMQWGGREGLIYYWTAMLMPLTTAWWVPRPQVFSYLFFALAAWIFTSPRRDLRWLLLPLGVVWANMHASFILLPALAALFIIERRVRDGRWAHNDLLFALVATLLTLVNPYGLRLWRFMVWVSTTSGLTENITEWQSPDFSQHGMFIFFVAMAVIITLMVIRQIEKPPVAFGLLLLGTSLLFLTAVRYWPYAVISLVWWGGYINPPFQLESRMVSRLGAAALVLTIAAAGFFVYGMGRVRGLGVADLADPGKLPVRAVDYLDDAQERPRRLYAPYSWGGYLIFRGYPVFIDGRADMYYGPVLTAARDILWINGDPLVLLDQYGVTEVMAPANSGLGVVLQLSGAWSKVYSDSLASIWRRR